MIGTLPVHGDGRLRLTKAYLARADEALQLHFDAIFAPGFGPGLELQIIQRTGMSAKCEWNDVVELVLAGR